MQARRGRKPKTKNLFAFLFFLILVGRPMASFKSGYYDNQCTVTVQSVIKEQTSGYTSSDPALITYKYACPDNIGYTLTIRQAKYGDVPTYLNPLTAPKVEATVANPCMPPRLNDQAMTYDDSRKTFLSNDNVYPGHYNCADLGLPIADAGFATLVSSTKASSLSSWGTPTDVTNSNNAYRYYIPSDYTVSMPYANKILPARSWNSSTFRDRAEDDRIDNSRWFIKITSKKDPYYFAIVHLFPGMTDNDYLNKPLVVADAFDAHNRRGLTDPRNGKIYQNVYAHPQYKNLLSASGPRGKGYDVFFIDFSQGAGDIHLNAGIELKFLEWLNSRTAAKPIVGGMSMSGVVGRLALLYSMPANNRIAADQPNTGVDYGKNIKGFLAVDAPMQGASISANLQATIKDLTGYWVVWLADGMGLNTDAQDSWDQVVRPASHQMLYEHYYGGTASHDGFYQQIADMGGYRRDLPQASIAYSNFYQPHHTTDYSERNTTWLSVGGRTWYTYAKGAEWMPGSSGDWYYNSYKGKVALSGYDLKNFGTPAEFWKGTFIPIKSALDLDVNYNSYDNPAPTNRYTLAAHSPFQYVDYMERQYNGYCNTANTCTLQDSPSPRTSVNDMRYAHIVFDPTLVAKVNKALDWLERSVVSLNNDKYDDLLFYGPTSGLHATLSNGSGFTYSGNWYADGALDMPYMMMGDFNGDGFMDMAYQDAYNALKVALSDGTRFLPFAQWIAPNAWGHRNGKLYVGDFNGDRKDDLLFFEPGNNSISVSLSTGSGFGASGTGQWVGSNGFGSLKNNYLIGDFNGDGKSDVGYWEGDQSFYVKMSSGTGFGSTSQWLPPGYFGNLTATPYIGDFNGDGLDDMMFFNSTYQSLYMLPSTGTRFATLSQQWTKYQTFGNNPTAYYPADYNGDGFCDMGYFESGDYTFHIALTNAAGTGFNVPTTWVSPDGFGNPRGRYFTTYRKKRILIN
jgi:hypothetical protein